MPAHPFVHAGAARCLERDADTDVPCPRRPTDGVFCAAHAYAFRCHKAAEAATRLAATRVALQDTELPPLRRWWLRTRARRLLALRRHLLEAIARFEGPVADVVIAFEAPPDLWPEGR